MTTLKPLLILAAFISFNSHADPVETIRFEVELNQQMCTGGDEAGFVCGSDGTHAPIEVALDRVKASEIEDWAAEGTSEPLGLALNSSLRHLPSVSVRLSRIGRVSMYTLRFRSSRGTDEAKPYETVYIEEGEGLKMAKPLTLMADRFGNGVRFFRQVFLTLRKVP